MFEFMTDVKFPVIKKKKLFKGADFFKQIFSVGGVSSRPYYITRFCHLTLKSRFEGLPVQALLFRISPNRIRKSCRTQIRSYISPCIAHSLLRAKNIVCD